MYRYYQNGLWVAKGREPWEPPSTDPEWPPVIGTYKPGPDTTGPRPDRVLTTVVGDVTVNTPNAIIEDKDIYGRIILQNGATTPIIRNCIIRGPGSSFTSSGTTFHAVIASTASTLRGAIIEDCIIDLTGRNTPWCDGIRGSDYTVRRCEIRQTTDGIGLTHPAGNVTIEGNWIHDCWYEEWIINTPNKPTQSDARTHNDCVQFHRGKNYRIVGNLFGGYRVPGPRHPSPYNTVDQTIVDSKNTGDDYENACIMLQQEGSTSAADKIENVLIEFNYFAGGASGINITDKYGNMMETVTIRNNKWMRQTWGGTYYYVIRSPGVANYDTATNVFEDTGLPVPVTKGSSSA